MPLLNRKAYEFLPKTPAPDVAPDQEVRLPFDRRFPSAGGLGVHPKTLISVDDHAERSSPEAMAARQLPARRRRRCPAGVGREGH